MIWQKYYPYFLGLILLIAVQLRVPDLSLRPLHGDEAVNAVKFGTLLENGTYTYDPHEYHGPTLYYFTLISAWTPSIGSFEDLSESSLRIIPVIFGLLTILGLAFLGKGMARPVILLSALLLAISPAVVYYNRYYIHESLLVFFSAGTLVSAYFYIQKKNILSAILCGAFLGLMIATKETWIIFLLAMIIALLGTFKPQTIVKSINLLHLLSMLGSAALICILFYSSFFQNLQGIPDALISYKEYFLRASGNQIHHHPWYYYLALLVYFKNGSFPFWSEGIIIVLAITGIVLLIRKQTTAFGDATILRFISIYTISLILIFSLIPYKTPWNLLGFLPGLAILSAFAIIELSRIWSKKYMRVITCGLIMVGLTHLLWESVILNYKYYSSPANPYVYAHPGKDVFYIQEQINQIIKTHPEGKNIHIQVIAPGDDYWPLPWYFRSYHRIGWWNHVPVDEPAAPVIILAADLEPDLIQNLYERPPPGKRDLYLPIFNRYTELRPGIEFRGYIKKADWDLMQRTEVDTEIK